MSIIVLPARKPRNKDILALSNHKKFIYRSSVEIRDSIGLKIRSSQIKNCCYNIVIYEGKEKVDEFSIEMYYSFKYDDNILIRHKQQQIQFEEV